MPSLRRLFLLAAAAFSIGLAACDKEPTKPKVQPPPTTGTLVVTSIPSPANVYFGRTQRGITPATFAGIDTGLYVVNIYRTGFDVFSKTVRVRPNCADTIAAVLDSASATLVLTSEPPGATIVSSFLRLFSVTPDSLRLDASWWNWWIGLQLTNFQDWDTTYVPQPHERRAIHVVMQPTPNAPGKIIVTSEPSGASIFLDGFGLNKVTPDTLKNVAPGFHVVQLRKTDYRNLDLPLTLLPGGTVTVHGLLVRLHGRLSVSSTPPGAEIWLDNASTGRRTPAIVDSLAPKSYALRLTLSNYADWTRTVTVADNQTTTVDAVLQIGCPGDTVGDLNQPPFVRITQAEAGRISGVAGNLYAKRVKVVLYALTNIWYIQPYADARKFTNVCGDGTWSNVTHAWKRMVALLVDTSVNPSPGSVTYDHPAYQPGVLAWDEYPVPAQRQPIAFSGRDWGIRVSEDLFGAGPNYWSDRLENVSVDGLGQLHLGITIRDGKVFCSEVHLLEPLDYGTYTYQVFWPSNDLDSLAVFSGFLYEAGNREFDFERSKVLARPYNGQYVVQPYTTPGNLVRFPMPGTEPTTTRIAWRPDRIEFLTWKGHGAYPPAPGDVVYAWTYTGANNFVPGKERFRFNHWMFQGQTPIQGVGNEVVVRSFTYEP
jgi:hypothetical protein